MGTSDSDRLARIEEKIDNLVEYRTDHGTRIKWLERVVYSLTPLLVLVTGYQITPIGG